MKTKTHHVIFNQKGGWSVWSVKKRGSLKASKAFDTKKSAVDYGIQVSKNQKSELVIHDKNGRVSKIMKMNKA